MERQKRLKLHDVMDLNCRPGRRHADDVQATAKEVAAWRLVRTTDLVDFLLGEDQVNPLPLQDHDTVTQLGLQHCNRANASNACLRRHRVRRPGALCWWRRLFWWRFFTAGPCGAGAKGRYWAPSLHEDEVRGAVPCGPALAPIPSLVLAPAPLHAQSRTVQVTNNPI